jgi:acyl-CoA oxidase
MAAGAYDMAVRYTLERRQFGAPLASFQLIQERLARMQGQVQGMWLVAWRLTRLLDTGLMTHEQASLAKAFTTRVGREAVALARETLGGNGILSQYLAAKAHADLEAIFTYEGTYDVNALVAGRGITGLSAIKPPSAGAKR